MSRFLRPDRNENEDAAEARVARGRKGDAEPKPFQDAKGYWVPADFRVGDTVEFMYATRPLRGQIIEDRGNLARGQRLYRVRVERADDPLEIELPVSELRRVDDEEKKANVRTAIRTHRAQ